MDYPNRDLLIFDRRNLGATELDYKQMRLNGLARECRSDPIRHKDGMNAPNGNDRVRFVQEALNMAYGATLEVDGKFGPETLRAIQEFQKAHALKVDGTVGQNTMQAIADEVNARNHASVAVSSDPLQPARVKLEGGLGIITWQAPAESNVAEISAPGPTPAVAPSKGKTPQH